MQLCAFKTLIYNGKIIVTIEGDIIVQYLFFLCLGFYLYLGFSVQLFLTVHVLVL